MQTAFDDKFLSIVLLIKTRSGLLVGIRWSVYISRSQRILCVSFSKTNSGLCMYHLSVWTNFNRLHYSQSIPFPTQSFLFLYSLCASLLNCLLFDKLFHFYYILIFICYSSSYYEILLRQSSYGIISYCYWEIQFLFSGFPFPATFSSFRVQFLSLSHEISFQLFFFPFLFSRFFFCFSFFFFFFFSFYKNHFCWCCY